jgi:hypothetical protein
MEALEGMHARLIGLEPQPGWRESLKTYIENELL